MLKLTFAVPYPKLKTRVLEVFQRYQKSTGLDIDLFLTEVDWKTSRLTELPSEIDVLIARGYGARLLQTWYKGELTAPVVEMSMSAYDVIHAVQECERQFSAKKVGFVGDFLSIAEAHMLDSFFHCDFRAYFSPDQTEIRAQVRRALDDGCDAIIGGLLACTEARDLNIPAFTIETGDTAIWQAIEEAIRLSDATRKERERAQMVSVITETSKDGILYVNQTGEIQLANAAARELLATRKSPLLNTNLNTLSPPIASAAAEVCRSGKEVSNQLFTYKKNTLSLDYSPILVDRSVTGVVVTCQDVTRIQQTEAAIRQKLSEKGLNARYRFDDIIHCSDAIDQLIRRAQRYAAVDSNILIEGETGTGKELLAQSIHNDSPRKSSPFVAVNCAAIPENLLESELFGYEEGAFTGSLKGGKAGLFELAHTGTLFLDEVSELPLSFQSKLLRVLQEREIRRVGGSKVKSVDVRIIAACNCSLLQKVKDGEFRRDLFYRLDVLKLHIPALSHRREDIPLLFLHFLGTFAKKYHMQEYDVAPEALQLLSEFAYQGNIRELRNIAERVCIVCMDTCRVEAADVRSTLYDEDTITPPSLPDPAPARSISAAPAVPYTPPTPFRRLPDDEQKKAILAALEQCGFNQTRAAQQLGIDRTTLWRKAQKFSIPLR